MPSENAAADFPHHLPPDLTPDFLGFKTALSERLAPGAIRARAMLLLTRFGALVHEHSDRLALVARGDRPILFTRHILDSLNPMEFLSPPPVSALDIGSGAGFPGIPLAIVWPETRVTLLESRDKKCGFLERAARELGLRNVTVICARLEDYQKTWRAEPHACVLIRAVGDLPRVLVHARAAATPGAGWVYFLGGEIATEDVIRRLGLAGEGARIVVGPFGGKLLCGQFRRD